MKPLTTRQKNIIKLIRKNKIKTQTELISFLEKNYPIDTDSKKGDGYSQATISEELKVLNIKKENKYYILPPELIPPKSDDLLGNILSVETRNNNRGGSFQVLNKFHTLIIHVNRGYENIVAELVYEKLKNKFSACIIGFRCVILMINKKNNLVYIKKVLKEEASNNLIEFIEEQEADTVEQNNNITE